MCVKLVLALSLSFSIFHISRVLFSGVLPIAHIWTRPRHVHETLESAYRCARRCASMAGMATSTSYLDFFECVMDRMAESAHKKLWKSSSQNKRKAHISFNNNTQKHTEIQMMKAERVAQSDDSRFHQLLRNEINREWGWQNALERCGVRGRRARKRWRLMKRTHTCTLAHKNNAEDEEGENERPNKAAAASEFDDRKNAV